LVQRLDASPFAVGDVDALLRDLADHDDVFEACRVLAVLHRVDVGLGEGNVGLARDEHFEVRAGARRRAMEYVVVAQLPFEILRVDALVGAPGLPARNPYRRLVSGVGNAAEQDEQGDGGSSHRDSPYMDWQ